MNIFTGDLDSEVAILKNLKERYNKNKIYVSWKQLTKTIEFVFKNIQSLLGNYFLYVTFSRRTLVKFCLL